MGHRGHVIRTCGAAAATAATAAAAAAARLLLDLELEMVAGDALRDDTYNENIATPSSGVAWGYVYVTIYVAVVLFYACVGVWGSTEPILLSRRILRLSKKSCGQL